MCAYMHMQALMHVHRAMYYSIVDRTRASYVVRTFLYTSSNASSRGSDYLSSCIGKWEHMSLFVVAVDAVKVAFIAAVSTVTTSTGNVVVVVLQPLSAGGARGWYTFQITLNGLQDSPPSPSMGVRKRAHAPRPLITKLSVSERGRTPWRHLAVHT